jgi:cyclopropane fatty-acyl-phospholipid synthase-like methyltransferase
MHPRFETAYDGTPPWDIARPQKEIVRLARAGDIQGEVLDVGCGTGENALYLARLGHDTLGIDAAQPAIEKAQAKARERGIDATFMVYDAIHLKRFDRAFDTVIDSGLFHVFTDRERKLFADGLAAVLRSGGTYFMLCMSENEPADWGGPRRVRQSEIRETFSKGWEVNFIREAHFEINQRADANAWLASITRI